MNTTRTVRRIATTAAGLALTAAASMLTATPATAADWQLHQLDYDRCYDMATLDTEDNGYANDIYMDLDNDCRWDTRQWNTTGHDSFHERMSFDRDEDGSLNTLLVDTNQRQGFDYVRFDRNDDGYWDTGWRYFSSGYSATQDMAQAAVNLGPGQWVYNPYL